MHPLTHTPLEHITLECHEGASCELDTPGHAIGSIQNRVATATPSKWRDYRVESFGQGGWIRLRSIDGAADVLVWNHGALDGAVEGGTPVSLHALYNVLAVGAARFNVAVLDAV
jgi:hypothetical protein